MAKSVNEERDERRAEIRDLKRRIEKLEKDSDKEYYEKSMPKKKRSGYLKVLVLLIIILIVVDMFSLIAYYKPDFSGMIKFGNSGNSNTSNGKPGVITKCSDGTDEGACSKNKPLLCYQGELLSNAHVCGCPSGYKLSFQSCVKA